MVDKFAKIQREQHFDFMTSESKLFSAFPSKVIENILPYISNMVIFLNVNYKNYSIKKRREYAIVKAGSKFCCLYLLFLR